MPQGTVKWYNESKGFGFITPENLGHETTSDVFVHSSNIIGGGSLNEGQIVSFDLEDGRKGPEAKNVQPV